MKPTIKAPDFRKAIVELEKQSDQVLAKVRVEIGDTAKEVVELAKKRAPINESNLKGSISFQEITPFQYEIVANAKYAGFMEFGTRTLVEIPPGAEEIAAEVRKIKGGNIAEMEKSVRRWVRLKGIVGTFSVKTKRRNKRNKDEEAREDSAVFLIMRKLLKVGVKPQPFFFPSIKEATKDLGKRIAKIIR
jgi:hypothetical protein